MWGHLLSKGVLPLFLRVGDKLEPVGTAFWVGRNIPFVVTALHNVAETLRREPQYERLLASGNLPEQVNLETVALYVLHQDEVRPGRRRFTLLPLESVNAGPPTDVVFGFPRFEAGRATWSPPVSFSPPRIGETVWSIGYTDYQPREGIPLASLSSEGHFDWVNHYRHRLVVTEGMVTRIFTQRFAAGFTCGPCFAFDNAIEHGQSGGPILTTDGRIVGINSATATNFFNAPTSLGSMIYPLLMSSLQFGCDLGNSKFHFRMNATRLLIELVTEGHILTDGSEEHVAIRSLGDDGYAVCPRIPTEDQAFTHADFRGFQEGRPAPTVPNGTLCSFIRSRSGQASSPGGKV